MVVILVIVLLFMVIVGGITLLNQSTAMVAQSSALAMNSASALLLQGVVCVLALGLLALVAFVLIQRNSQNRKASERVIVLPAGYGLTTNNQPALRGTVRPALASEDPGLMLLESAQTKPALPEPQQPAGDFWSLETPWKS